MPINEAYEAQIKREQKPVVNGRRYRAQDWKVVLGQECNGCTAFQNGQLDEALCNALPKCVRSMRLHGRHVVYVDEGWKEVES